MLAKIINEKYTVTMDAFAVVNMERYTFSPAFYVEFCECNCKDFGRGTYKGANQFRLDFTKLGRFECEFLDHTYSYRGENEVTVLATTDSGEWILSASIPTNVYHGCVVLVELGKLDDADKKLFEKFGIDIEHLIKTLEVEQKWCKISHMHKFTDIFAALYVAREYEHSELILVRALELLVLLSKSNKEHPLYPIESDYIPSKLVVIVKKIHDSVLKKYDKVLSFEQIAQENGITYSRFNAIFKVIYGDTPYQYLKKLRMNIAAQKLKKTDLSVLDIATSVGYSNSSNFANAFKSVFGELPHIFRK